MSEEEKRQKKRDFQNTLTLVFTILTLAAVPIGIWCVNARFTMEADKQAKFNADNYVPKEWFNKSHEETSKQITDLSQRVSELSTQSAVISSKLDNVVHTR